MRRLSWVLAIVVVLLARIGPLLDRVVFGPIARLLGYRTYYPQYAPARVAVQ